MQSTSRFLVVCSLALASTVALMTVSQAATTYTVKVSLEVKSKYPGTSSAMNVIVGCKTGFPVDKNFTSASRWEVLGAQKELVGTSSVGKVSVKSVLKVTPPFQAEDVPELQPYIYGGTCVYTGSIKVTKSNAYSFRFAGVDLGANYSFAELTSKKWNLVITKDLNCGGLYGTPCN